MFRPLALAALLAAGCAARPAAVAPIPAQPALSSAAAEAAFGRLRALLGDWEATTAKGATIRTSYRFISNDSALVETFTTASGKETLTIFHLDGPRVVATHYCAQKNQPRLVLRPPTSDTRFEFSFFDATNLLDAHASHLTKLGVVLVDAQHFEKTEVYEENGKDDTTVLAFHRSANP